jgi:nicotinamidase-related amidase
MKRFHSLLLVAVAAAAIPTSAFAQAVTDDWASAKMPDAPAVKAVTVDPKTTALIVMDFNKQGCSQQRRPRCVTALPHVQKILEEARSHNMYVVHTLAGTTTVADIPASIAPKAGEQAYSAGPDKFISTTFDLQKTLKDKGITTLIAVGTAANGAELYTASSAVFHGFKAIVPVDAMPGDTPFSEAMSIWQMSKGPRVADGVTLTKVDMIGFGS